MRNNKGKKNVGNGKTHKNNNVGQARKKRDNNSLLGATLTSFMNDNVHAL